MKFKKWLMYFDYEQLVGIVYLIFIFGMVYYLGHC